MDNSKNHIINQGNIVGSTMDYLCKKWALMILLELYECGEEWKRFTEIRDSIKGVTPKILSERLRELNREELIVKRVDASSVPVKSEYKLTAMGAELIEIVKYFEFWTLKWKSSNYVHED